MKYSINLAENGRILSVTYAKYAPAGAVLVDELPDGNVENYRYTDGKYIYDPLPVPEVEHEPTVDEILNALLGVTE